MARTWEVGPGTGSVGCTLELAIESPAEIALQVMAHRPERVIQEHLRAASKGQDLVGNRSPHSCTAVSTSCEPSLEL